MLWRFLEVGGRVELVEGHAIDVAYPVLAWVGVMAAGYGLGGLFRLEAARRRRTLLWLGTGMTLAFFAVRGLDGYGYLAPWSHQSSAILTALSFLNATKYPPSLAYLLVTLGPRW